MTNGSSVEERLVRLETKWEDYIDRSTEVHDRLIECVESMDAKVDGLLIREAELKGQRKEHRNLAIKVASFVSLIVGGIINVVVNTFR
jgi:hypothetical protein